MSELILKCGNPITQHVQMVFPEGGIASFTKSGLKIASRAAGAGSAIGTVMDASLALARKVHGGMNFPGTLHVYSDKVVFQPAFQFLSGLYEGIETVTIPASIIRDVELTTKFMVIKTIDIKLTSGDHVRFVASAEGEKIARAIRSIA